MTEPIFWEGPLALIEESYLITCISALLGVGFIYNYDLSNPGDILDMSISVIMSIFVTVWPFFVLIMLLKNADQIK